VQLPAVLDRGLALRRVVRRVGVRPRHRSGVRPPVDQPVGVKLELTYRCNLRCGFCYTDSPRRTLEGTLDLPDDAWRGIVDDAIDLGVIEAVVTGGEPLLRRELALELIERLGRAGVGVSLNTNGWFVDDELADRLAAVRGIRVHVSIDGASAQVHDVSRGVPGSWRRAVEAVDRLLARGVAVQAIHVVNPANAPTLDECLEHMWLLGVRAVGMSTVVPIGAAARAPGWAIDRRCLDRAARAVQARHGRDLELVLEPPAIEGLATRDDRPPASLLVRPNGAVLMDSVHPFSLGRADEGLGECWRRILEHWRDPAVADWARGIRSVGRVGELALVPYRDDEVALAGPAVPTTAGRQRRNGQLLEPPDPVRPTDLEAARREILDLALARRYRLGDVRWAGSASRERYVRVLEPPCTYRVNGTVGAVMDACDDGTAGDAVRALSARHPRVPRARLERDTVQAVRWLCANRVLRAARQPSPGPGRPRLAEWPTRR
jgi:MoaA/NifB/PqqE/SkfB family radical SAM enzyme